MKSKIIEVIAFVLGLLTTVAGALTFPQVALLPQKYQPYIAFALAVVIVGKNGAYIVMDFLDDGLLNQSYKLPKGLGVWLLCGLALMLASCGSAPNGEKTFLGATGGQWTLIGKRVLIREVPVVYGEVKDAREVTSAKEPVGVVVP